MDSSKIDMFMASMASKFPPERLMMLKECLEKMDDSKFFAVQSMDYQDPTIMLVVSIVAGTLGIDRFLVGDIGLGILKLLTGGCCGVLYLVDWFLIMNRTKEKNFEKFMMIS